MKIYLPEVRQRTDQGFCYTFSGTIPASFEPEFCPADRLQVDAEVRISGDKVFLAGKVIADLREVCCRCLGDFTRHLETDFNETFTWQEEDHLEGSPAVLAVEAANQQTVKGNYLYLDEYLRQVLLLARGYRSLCRDDCRGICPVCGADLNSSSCSCAREEEIDPRLSKLKDFPKI